MIESNLRLVVSISNKFIIKSSNYIVDSLDIIQYGNEGLIKAVEKFDVDLGYRFSTYATYWIKLYIEEGLSKTARTIRLPKDIIIYYDKIKKYKDKKIKLTGIIPSNLEIAKELGLKECHIKHIIDSINMQPVSIYDIAKGQKDITLLEFIPSEDDPMEEIIIQHNSIKKLMTV